MDVRLVGECQRNHLNYYLVFNFYQINRDGEIRTRDRLIIKALILYQRNHLNPKT